MLYLFTLLRTVPQIISALTLVYQKQISPGLFFSIALSKMMDSGLPSDPRGQRALRPGLGYEERLVECQSDKYEEMQSGGNGHNK